ncbi:hypothetical protein M0804_009571 [Polistes exclamans]|nr:hypothetical protein M0804_009571 [Polistes exclamans]
MGVRRLVTGWSRSGTATARCPGSRSKEVVSYYPIRANHIHTHKHMVTALIRVAVPQAVHARERERNKKAEESILIRIAGKIGAIMIHRSPRLDVFTRPFSSLPYANRYLHLSGDVPRRLNGSPISYEQQQQHQQHQHQHQHQRSVFRSFKNFTDRDISCDLGL